MLSTKKRKYSIFNDERAVANFIDIHLENAQDPSSFCDTNDACMKAVVRAYDAGVVQSSTPFHLSGPQVIVWLTDLSKIQIRINTPNDGTVISPENTFDKDTILVKCAMQSLLKKLAAEGLIEKKNLLLQVRPRGQLGGPMFCMKLNPEENGCRFFSDGFISHTYAYLDDNHMCIFLNRNLLMDREKTQVLRNAIATITGTVTQPAADDDDRKQLQISGRR